MRVGNLVYQSFADEESKVLACVFTQGCNLNCIYCHNQDLIPVKGGKEISPGKILDLLTADNFLVDGLLITGGEPTIQPDIEELVDKATGFVMMNTNGTRPDVLEKIASKVSKITMDVKAPPSKYKKITGVAIDKKINESLKVLANHQNVEYRITWSPSYLSFNDVRIIRDWIKSIVPDPLIVIQRYKAPPFTAPKFQEPTISMLEKMREDFNEV